jgi:hypothetical protein
MTGHSTLALTTAFLSLGIAVSGTATFAQERPLKEQLTGTWAVVSVDNVAADGSKQQNFGANPKGVLMLDAGGRYAHTQVRADVPKFQVNNRMQGTPDENKAAVQGTVATFGTWSVDEAGKTLILRVEGSMFPNQAGEDSKRSVSIAGDELTVRNPSATAGGSGVSVFRRAK